MSAGDPGRSEPRQVEHPPPSAWNIANALTVLRLLLVPVFAWLLLAEGGTEWAYRVAALVVFVLAMITDTVDGDLARRRHLITDFGKVADPIADKALTGTAFVCLSLLAIVPWWVTVVILAREIGVTLVRFLVIRHGVMPAGRGGKLKTLLQAGALVLLIFPLESLPGAALWMAVAYTLLAVALVVTVVTGADYLLKARRLVAGSQRTARRRAAAAERRSRRRSGEP